MVRHANLEDHPPCAMALRVVGLACLHIAELLDTHWGIQVDCFQSVVANQSVVEN